GAYPFDRYDVVFIPGFVAGGMENPQLNFLNDGYILGNGAPGYPSSVVAHELAHSWFGDRITCATWSDTWLNEGFATYYANRFYELLGFDERAQVGYYWDRQNVESQIGIDPYYEVLHREMLP